MAAQQNWAAIPCFSMSSGEAVSSMFMDSLHNEIILNCTTGSSICNTTYKGLFAYNGNQFHDLNKGVNTHNPNAASNALLTWGCIPYNNKTVFGGGFYSVGTNTLYSKSIATWNGAVWDTFPTRCFNNTPNNSSGGGFYGFTKWNGKLWMYGGFDTIGNTITKNLSAYNGNTFTAVPQLPVTSYGSFIKVVPYKNKLVVAGNFINTNASTFWRLAEYDGSSWSTVGNGVQGLIGGVWDMAIYRDTLYIGGSFSTTSGNIANYLMKWDGAQLTDAGFGNYCGFGGVLSLVPFKNRLYAFGGFACAANQKAFGVAYLENGTWTVPQDSIEGNSIFSAVVHNNSIYIGGNFQSINGDNNINKFAKLICPDFDAASGCISGVKERLTTLDIKVYPNPSNGRIRISFENTYSIDRLSISNNLGQEMLNLFKPTDEQEVDISTLPTGIYFLKLENKQTYGVYKIVKD